MKIIVQFSGGKDSLACLLWAVKKYPIENIEAVFCDTKWEHDITYDHIKKVTDKIGVKLVTVTATKYDGFLGMVEKKKRFPSSKARFCTEELKLKPMIDYVLSIKEHIVFIQGIRKAESVSRSKMQPHCRFFKYYNTPYGHDKNGKPKYHSYRRKEVEKWTGQYSDDIIRPVFDWSGEEVIQYILDNGFEPNPLYSMGMARVGCMPCIMARLNEIKQISNRFPEVIEKIEAAETNLNTSFFTNGKIPDRFCSKFNKKPYPVIRDVVDYVTDGNQESMFKDHDKSCMSYYGICE